MPRDIYSGIGYLLPIPAHRLLLIKVTYCLLFLIGTCKLSFPDPYLLGHPRPLYRAA